MYFIKDKRIFQLSEFLPVVYEKMLAMSSKMICRREVGAVRMKKSAMEKRFRHFRIGFSDAEKVISSNSTIFLIGELCNPL